MHRITSAILVSWCPEEAPPGSAGVPPACAAVSAAQFPCDGAPGHPFPTPTRRAPPACTAVADHSVSLRWCTRPPRLRDPPGSAGVPPACAAVACHSVSLRWCTRPPCRRDPPGSAGVPPACTAVACHSVSLRWCTRPPCRREPHGRGRSRILPPLPVDPAGGVGRGCARPVRAGRPRSRGHFLPWHRRSKKYPSVVVFILETWRQPRLRLA